MTEHRPEPETKLPPARSDRVWTWREQPGITTAGRAFHGDQLLAGFDLGRHLLAAHRHGRLADTVRDLNGSFAFVIGQPDRPEVAGVDRLRSIPLFYTWAPDGRVRVGPDAAALRSGPVTPDLADAACFLRCGYTFGPHTLHPEIQQVQAGSYVSLGQFGTIVEERYHRHVRCLRSDIHAGRSERTNEALDRLSSEVGRRMVQVLDGRQALVPLSGGYDSRYVVSMLAEQGYPDVQLVTYGTPDGIEARIARKVADAFGYPWTFVDYTASGLADHVRGEAFARYWRTAGNLCTLPHVQEPYALAELQRRGLIDRDAVAVPGFCGDFLGGSYLPSEVVAGRVDELLSGGLAEHLIARVLYLRNRLEPRQWAGLRQRLSSSLSHSEVCPHTLSEFVAEANAWVAEHRVARYVINALRAYETAGIDWYLPLWDTELVDCWYRAPVSDLVRKQRYNGYLLEHRFPQYGVSLRQYPSYWSSAWFKRVRRVVPRSLVNPLWRVRDRATGTRRFDVNAFGPIAAWGAEALGGAAPAYDGNISAVLVNRYLHDVATGFASVAGPTDHGGAEPGDLAAAWARPGWWA